MTELKKALAKDETFEALLAALAGDGVDPRWAELLAGTRLDRARGEWPDELVAGPLFRGRGDGRTRMLSRLLRAIAAAPRPCAPADALRDGTTKLHLKGAGEDGTEPVDLRDLTAWQRLTQVQVSHAPSVTGLAGVAHVAHVSFLTLGVRVDVAELRRSTALAELDLGSTVEGLEPLGALPTLHRLWVVKAPLATLPSLAGFAALRHLALRYLEGPGPMPALPPGLVTLDVNGCPAELDVAACTALEELWVTGVEVRSVVGLAGARRLRKLWLNYTSLPRMPRMALDSLETIYSSTALGDIESLRGAPVLETLRLKGAKELRGFDVLATMPRLTTLELSSGTPYWLAREECPLLPTVRHLVISDQNVEDTHFVAGWAPAVETLTFDGCSGFLELVGIGGLPSLREISLKRTGMKAKDIPKILRERKIEVVLN